MIQVKAGLVTPLSNATISRVAEKIVEVLLREVDEARHTGKPAIFGDLGLSTCVKWTPSTDQFHVDDVPMFSISSGTQIKV